MNKDFPRILTLLRKEKKLSQKQVACDLEVSQALLSHYEKGIRECGLDFLLKVSDYYNVSCDYLLGKTTERNGAKVVINEYTETSINYGDAVSQFNRNMIQNSAQLLFDIADTMENPYIKNIISDYIMTSVYKIFRMLYCANPENPQAMFSISEELYNGYATAYQSIAEAQAKALMNGVAINETTKPLERRYAPVLSQDILVNEYAKYSASMLNLIKTVENKIKP